jgi:hypothetical protein
MLKLAKRREKERAEGIGPPLTKAELRLQNEFHEMSLSRFGATDTTSRLIEILALFQENSF